ncbi:hypothetical protein B4082_1476 [Bacillus cereus]|uniref:Uncharacterized protein n=1 Tax=Bacillus cereus TaxID=1396 RepID=A0A164GRZ3_BACCE|nr:hypothetical protein B4082_1476 [Bacillus cereus]
MHFDMQYFIFIFGNGDEAESVTYTAICGRRAAHKSTIGEG